MDAERLRLQELLNRLGGGKRELLLSFKLRHDVVVIGVEPLGHLHCRGGAGLLLVPQDATSHDEIGTPIDVWPVPVVTLGDGSDHRDRVEDMVVEGKIVGGNVGKAELLLELPVLFAKSCRLLQQLGFATLARPELSERFFEFALAPNTRVTE